MGRSINISGKKRQYEPQSGIRSRIRPAAIHDAVDCGFNNSAAFVLRMNRLSFSFTPFSNAAPLVMPFATARATTYITKI
ncbi:hypothetical protein [Paraburkholderia phenoliruptrix]|uniref:hypothetical protein n=1 Tax=Paraburkholderia phenoliruptrix TaxID=252970 RepID=UPI0034CE8F4D